MKVLLVGYYRRERGLSTMVRQLAKFLTQHGHAVTVQAKPPVEVWGDEEWTVVQEQPPLDDFELAIVLEFWDFGKNLASIGRTIWIPMAEYLMSQQIPAYQKYSAIVAPTQMAHRWLMKAQLPSFYIPWEVCPPPATHKREGPDCRFLHFTRADNHKKSGTDLLVRAWEKYGKQVNGTLTVKSIGPVHSIKLPGDVQTSIVAYPSLEGIYAFHDAIVQPSRREGIGLHVLEARARGLVTLVNGHTTLSEFVDRQDWLIKTWTGRPFRSLCEREADVEHLGQLLVRVAAERQDHLQVAAEIASQSQARYAKWEESWIELLNAV